MKRSALSLVLLVLLPSLSVAQSGSLHALLVGAQTYNNGMRNLNFAENDVVEFGQLLRDAGADPADVVVMTQPNSRTDPKLFPSRQNILKQLDLLLNRVGDEDSVIVGLAGHGVRFEKKVEDQRDPVPVNFFVPPDGSLRDTGTLLDVDDIYQRLKDSPAQFKLLLSDACRNDAFLENAPRPGNIKLAAPSAPPGGVAALFSCQDKEFAWEDGKLGGGHGVFFYYVIDGLRGAADFDGDGKIAAEELSLYSKKQVARHVAKMVGEPQTPRLLGDLRGAFPIARPRAKPGDLWDQNVLKMPFSFIPAGAFDMGSPDNEADRQDDEFQHPVRITQPFYLGRYEVTQAEYERVMGTNPSYFSRTGSGKDAVAGKDTTRFPVETVTWYDAVEFCNKLSEMDGRTAYYRLTNVQRDSGRITKADVTEAGGNGYRLPTEAEWEYACRAGTKTAYYTGNDERALAEAGWYGAYTGGNSEKRTHLVGQKTPNALGVYDMHGNVWEWNWDWYDEAYYRGLPTNDPQNLAPGESRVLRGGSWDLNAGFSRAANRFGGTPDDRSFVTGFRLARTP